MTMLTDLIDRSVLDFNPINTIASHMSYWADEDVGHFVLSQMLANKTPPTPTGRDRGDIDIDDLF